MMRSGRSGRGFLKRSLIVLSALALITAILAAGCVRWISHDKVEKLRSVAETAGPVPPALRSAILAAEDPLLLTRPRVSLRSLLPPPRGTVQCGPSPIAYVLVRSMSRPRRAWRWHVETAVATYVVASVFTPEELLRIYAHELYMGNVDGRAVIGADAASQVYFGKETRHLTIAEAAMLGAMIRSPNVFSPIRFPARAMERRNRLLERMLRLRLIDEHEFRAAVAEPLRTSRNAPLL